MSQWPGELGLAATQDPDLTTLTKGVAQLGVSRSKVDRPAMEAVALNRGSLLISAAGRNADRVNGKFGSVGPPASSPYIMAVGALTQHLSTTCYSARSSAHAGGQVDVSGPGYQIHSAWPMPGRYRTISGSSAAGAHAAGAAALIAQATGCRGRQLWAEITQTSHRLLEPSADVGAGLVLAPQR